MRHYKSFHCFLSLLIVLVICSSAFGSTDTSGPWGIDAANPVFGNLSTALSSPLTVGQTIVVRKPMAINNKTVSGNRLVKVIQGGRIYRNAGKTLTFAPDSNFDAGDNLAFDGPGTVIGLKKAYPDNFIANTIPGTTDMGAAINAASYAVTGPNVGDAISFTGYVQFRAAKYRADSTLTYYGAPWKGMGYRSTMIEYHGSSVCLAAEGTSANRKILNIEGITFNGAYAAAATDGMHLAHVHRSQAGLRDVEVSFFPGYGMVETGPSWTFNLYGVLLKNNTLGGYYISSTIGDISTARNFFGCLIENNGQAGSGRGGGFHSPGTNAVTFNFYGCTIQSNKGLGEIVTSGGSMLVDGCYFETETDTVNAIYLGGTVATVSNNLFYGTAGHGGSAVFATSAYAKVTVTGNAAHDTSMFTAGTVRAESEAVIVAGLNHNFTYQTDYMVLGTVISRIGRQSVDGWFQENVAANQTNVVLERVNTTPTAFSRAFNPVRNGQVTGMRVILNATVTAGTLTVKVTKNGADIGGALTATITGGSGTVIDLPDGYGIPYLAGDNIGVNITTSAGFAPTSADMTVILDITT